MSQSHQGFLIHLPLSLRGQAETIAHRNGVSVNYFISAALNDYIERLTQKAAERSACNFAAAGQVPSVGQAAVSETNQAVPGL
jgi:hypothetical protein